MNKEMGCSVAILGEPMREESLRQATDKRSLGNEA
jgi:hypothetical protein